jgi:glucan 1,3-beta-glucosidase
MAAIPFATIALLNRSRSGIRPLPESMFAGIFAVAAVYVAFNEGPSNWQSLWTCGAYMLLALTLWQVRAPG